MLLPGLIDGSVAWSEMSRRSTAFRNSKYPSLARFGFFHRCHKPQTRNLLRTDTPKAIRLLALHALVGSTAARND
jgi:hypothetical protein